MALCVFTSVALSLTVASGMAVGADDPGWTEPVAVSWRDRAVVSYRARLAGDYLVLEAQHAKDWHTYAMDNVERARERSGKERPETELPTRVDVSGGIEVDGPWFQTKPENLSQEVIKWYTWGFEDTAVFAVKVARTSGDTATITIDGQACNESRCRMVDKVRIVLPIPPASRASAPFDRSGLVEVTESHSAESTAD